MKGYFGWIPDLPDHRDFRLSTIEPILAATPTEVDLSERAGPVYDQDGLGSCTGQATAGLFRFVDRQQGGVDLNPSRLQIYYDARAIRGWTMVDSGAYIRDALSVVHNIGAAPEELWPYDVSRFAEKPTVEAYSKAEQALVYLRVDQTALAMQSCLASGFPFVIGFSVYENFEVGSDGIAPMPGGKLLGGHAVLVVGYSKTTGRWKAMNSWSDEWGNAGFFEVPFAYFTDDDLSSDLWTIRQVSEQPTPTPVSIEFIRYKKNRKLIVWGTFDEDASLAIDGVMTEAGASDGRFILKRVFTPGVHTATVTSSSGQSASAEFQVP